MIGLFLLFIIIELLAVAIISFTVYGVTIFVHDGVISFEVVASWVVGWYLIMDWLYNNWKVTRGKK
jgi:hypothetical protein